MTFVSGIWLRVRGRPRNTGLLTLHKLVSLAAVVLIGLTLGQLNDGAQTNAGQVAAVVLTAALFICAIASGGWLSTEKPAGAPVLLVHLVAPPLSVLSAGMAIYLFAI